MFSEIKRVQTQVNSTRKDDKAASPSLGMGVP
jgi:hypothetical protein